MAVNGKKFDFNVLSHFEIDADKGTTKGVEIYIPGRGERPGLTLGVARAGGRSFARHRDAVFERYKKTRGRALAPDDEEHRTREVFAFCVRWFRVDGGEVVEYDEDTMTELLMRFEYIYNVVLATAAETEQYLVDAVEDATAATGNA